MTYDNDKYSADLTPAEVIVARSTAFGRADFGFIFDSYHSGSNFRRQFDDRDDYIQFGRSSLGRDFTILRCDILAEEIGEVESRVVFLLEMVANGVTQQFVELAWLQQENGCWRYHRGQKIAQDELPEIPEQLGFADFEKLDPATIF